VRTFSWSDDDILTPPSRPGTGKALLERSEFFLIAPPPPKLKGISLFRKTHHALFTLAFSPFVFFSKNPARRLSLIFQLLHFPVLKSSPVSILFNSTYLAETVLPVRCLPPCFSFISVCLTLFLAPFDLFVDLDFCEILGSEGVSQGRILVLRLATNEDSPLAPPPLDSLIFPPDTGGQFSSYCVF